MRYSEMEQSLNFIMHLTLPNWLLVFRKTGRMALMDGKVLEQSNGLEVLSRSGAEHSELGDYHKFYCGNLLTEIYILILVLYWSEFCSI